jgi:hypothetical protein
MKRVRLKAWNFATPGLNYWVVWHAAHFVLPESVAVYITANYGDPPPVRGLTIYGRTVHRA